MLHLSAVFVRETPNTLSRTGGRYSGSKISRTPLPKLGGQLSHGEASLFRMTVPLAVFGIAKVCRLAVENEK